MKKIWIYLILTFSILLNLFQYKKQKVSKLNLLLKSEEVKQLNIDIDSVTRIKNDLIFKYDYEFSEFFSFSEFDSRDKPGSGKSLDSLFIERLEIFNHLTGENHKVNSGVRSKGHNKKVGGAKNSRHVSGQAFDVDCNTEAERWRYIYAGLAAGFNGIGIGHGFIHFDYDPERSRPVIWLY